MKSKLFSLLMVIFSGIAISGCKKEVQSSTNLVKNTKCDLVVSLKAFSKRALASSLAEGKVVFIIIRSDESIWSKTLLNTKKAYMLQSKGKIDFLDLKWSWRSDLHEERKLFEKFGYTKEAFIVICRDGEFQRLPNAFAIDHYLSDDYLSGKKKK